MNQQTKKILIIEDEKLLQQFYFDKLVKQGFTVLQAFSGQQGVNMAINYRPDLILLDIMLPGGLNGFDVLSQLRRNPVFKKTPIIMITDLREGKKTALAMGANDYIVKKDDQIKDLISSLNNYLRDSYEK